MSGKLSKAELRQILYRISTDFPTSSSKLTSHIDALTAENERLRALVARMSSDALRAFDDGAPLPEQGWYEAKHPGQCRHLMELTSVTEEATKAENERLTRELGECQRRLAALAGDGATINELAEEAHEIYHSGRDHVTFAGSSNGWQADLVRMVSHVATRVRAPLVQQIAELTEKLEDAREQVTGESVYESLADAFNAPKEWSPDGEHVSKLVTFGRIHRLIAGGKAAHDRLSAELSQMTASRDQWEGLSGKLSETVQHLSNKSALAADPGRTANEMRALRDGEKMLAEVYSQAGNSAPANRRHALTPALRDNIRDWLKARGHFDQSLSQGEQRGEVR